MRPFLFHAALLLPLAALSGPPAVAGGPLLTAALRCEYREDPFGLDEPAPRLSWAGVGSGSYEFRANGPRFPDPLLTTAAP